MALAYNAFEISSWSTTVRHNVQRSVVVGYCRGVVQRFKRRAPVERIVFVAHYTCVSERLEDAVSGSSPIHHNLMGTVTYDTGGSYTLHSPLIPIM